MRKIYSLTGVAAGLALLISQPLAVSAATLSNVGLPAVGTPAAKLPAITTPQAIVSSVTVPAVTTPQVTTPVVKTPPVTTPVVKAPSVTTPVVKAPSVTTPVVKTPPVTTPVVKTPSVTTPKVTAPAAGAPSLSTPPATTPRVRTPNPPGSSAPPSAASGATSAHPGPSGTSLTLANVLGATPAHRNSASALGQPRRNHTPAVNRGSRQAQENRHLRTVVDRYQRCVSSLDSRSQRLLSLRAGLHGGARSAGAVARILHLSAAREQRLERRSLLALQTTGHRGCGGSATMAAAAAGSRSVTGNPATLASSASGASSPASVGAASSGASSLPHVSAARGRSSAELVVAAPVAIRTAEKAWAGQGPIPGKEIALIAVLVVAISLAWVRRRDPPSITISR